MPSKSSKRWLKEHFNDLYVKQAQQKGLRSRASFKLSELQEKYHLFKKGMTIIDLGAAPGGFSQLLKEYVGPEGRVIALDILPMESLPGVEFIQGDFTENAIFEKLLTSLAGQKVDWVISDMAPNLSGIPSVDQPRTLALAEIALEFALKVLTTHGGFLVKIFQGAGSDEFLQQLRTHFKKMSIRKPKASRGRSNEIYILARN